MFVRAWYSPTTTGRETDEHNHKHELININESSFAVRVQEPHAVVQKGHKCERETQLIHLNGMCSSFFQGSPTPDVLKQRKRQTENKLTGRNESIFGARCFASVGRRPKTKATTRSKTTHTENALISSCEFIFRLPLALFEDVGCGRPLVKLQHIPLMLMS